MIPLSQNPREIVQAAVHFASPERLPVRMASLGIDDTAWIPRKAHESRDEYGLTIDEWGCRWEHTDAWNMGQVKGHPLASLAEYDRVTVPDFSQDWLYEDCDTAFHKAEQEEKYTMTGIFMTLFERMHALAGFETVLVGLIMEPNYAAALADLILDAQLSFVRNCQERFGTHLNAFHMSDDWGTQQASFIDPALWREFFLPRYTKLFTAMHAGGQDVWVHSCGKVNEIIQGFIDAGVDAMNLQQPRALGIEEIGRRYQGKLAFESLSDIQATLPSGDSSRIEADAHDLAHNWMLPTGGFIFSDYGDGRAIGVEPKAKITMYNAFSRVSEDMYGRPLPKLCS